MVVVTTGVMQIRRTRQPDNPPTDLLPGQLSAELASTPPRLWVGVPASIDPLERRELLAGGEASNIQTVGGELVYVSPTELRFVRRNGGYIRHNGEMLLIPAEGFPIRTSELPITGPNITFYVFLWPEFGRTATAQHVIPSNTHRPSTAPGNEGVEVLVMSGVEHNDHTLLGMVRTDANGQFVDTAERRFVRSWFNRKPISLRSPDITGMVYAGGGPAELGTGFSWLHWTGEVLQANLFVQAHTTGQNWITWAIGIDGRAAADKQSRDVLQFWVWSGYRMATGVPLTLGGLSEGLHDARPLYQSAVAIQVYAGGAYDHQRLEGSVW